MRRFSPLALLGPCACGVVAAPPIESGSDTDPTSDTDADANTDTDTDTGGDAAPPDPDAPDAYAPYFRSGARLKAQAFELPGGAQHFARFYDPQIGGSCQLRTAGDGSLRCLPDEPLAFAGYADPSCTVAVYSAYEEDLDCIGDAFQLTLELSGSCDARYRVLGTEPFEGFDRLYEDFDEWGCLEADLPDPHKRYFRATQEISPSAFVRFELSAAVDETGFGVERAEGADGSRMTLGAFREGWGRCYLGQFEDLADGHWRCRPTNSVYIDLDYFGDSACSDTPLADLPECSTAAVAVHEQWNPDASRLQYGLYELVGEHTGSIYELEPVDQSCLLQPDPPAGRWFQAGPQVPAAQIPELFDELELRGDFGLQWLVDTSGRRLQSGSIENEPFPFWDGRLGAPCRPARLSDGQLVCAPGNPLLETYAYFSDPACTAPAVLSWAETPPEPGTLYSLTGYATECSYVGLPSTEVAATYELGEPLTELFVFDALQTNCLPTAIPASATALAMAPVDPLDVLGRIELVTAE